MKSVRGGLVMVGMTLALVMGPVGCDGSGDQGVGEGTRGVVILLDQSGSVSGFVQPDPALGNVEMTYDEANLAITNWMQSQGDPDVRKRLASDRFHARVAAVEDVIGRLDPYDKLLVLTYNEDYKGRLVCVGDDLPEPTAEACFTTRRDGVATGLDDIAGNEGGRTPLWEAVSTAYTFLAARPGPASRHLLLLSDGPDTCFPSAADFAGGTPCSDKGFDDVKAQVTGGANDVAVHVVQWAAAGYPAADPQQIELATLTGGTHAFVDGRDLDEMQFRDALKLAAASAIPGLLEPTR